MYVSIRTYRVGKGSLDELMHRVDRDLADAFVQETGFIAYQVARTGDRTVASITVFHERDQAERSNELAAEWVAESLADFDVERMGVMAGEVLSRAIADLLEPHTTDRAHGGEVGKGAVMSEEIPPTGFPALRTTKRTRRLSVPAWPSVVRVSPGSRGPALWCWHSR